MTSRLEELRLARGFSKGELALAAGISPSLLSQILSGKRTLTEGVREALAAVLDVSPLELDYRTNPITVADLLRVAEVSDKIKLAALVDGEWHEGSVPKADGSSRVVAEPPERLKELQYWILRQVLDRFWIHPFVFGGVAGRSAYDNARVHVGARTLVKIDILDFFGSITAPKVYHALRCPWVEEEVAKLIAMLCTRRNRLPQGAPTSTALANIVAAEMDQELLQSLPSQRALWRYTRYVDDLTFSSIVPTDLSGESVLSNALAVLAKHGFKPQQQKTGIFFDSERMEVTGYVINPTKVAPVARAPRELWKRLRTAVKKLEDGDAFESWETVWGLASHLGQSDPERAESFKERLRKMQRRSRGEGGQNGNPSR